VVSNLHVAYRILPKKGLTIAPMGAGCFECSIHWYSDEIGKQIWFGPV